MKKTFYIIGVFLFILSCQKTNIEDSSDGENFITAKAVASISSKLHYDGNGKWWGSFGPTTIWFNGATPKQTKNGIKSAWSVTTNPHDSQSYHKAGVTTVRGNGQGFYMNYISLGSSNKELIYPVLKAVKKNKNTIYLYTNFTNLPNPVPGKTYTVRGKIVLNANCEPIIVSSDSYFYTGCLKEEGTATGIPAD